MRSPRSRHQQTLCLLTVPGEKLFQALSRPMAFLSLWLHHPHLCLCLHPGFSPDLWPRVGTVSPCPPLSPRCRCQLPAHLWALTLLKGSKRAIHLSLRERPSDEKQAERKRSSDHPALILKQLADLPFQGVLPTCLERWAVSFSDWSVQHSLR